MLNNIIHTTIHTKKNGTIPLHIQPLNPPTASLPKILSANCPNPYRIMRAMIMAIASLLIPLKSPVVKAYDK